MNHVLFYVMCFTTGYTEKFYGYVYRNWN